MVCGRFSVEKVELVSDHLSTRFFIKDNDLNNYYDVRNIVSEGYEVQFDGWARAICDLLNNLNDENCELKKQIERNNV